MPEQDKSVTQVLSELKDLTVSYAKQETVDPLRNVGRWVGYGVGGAFVLGIGLCLLSLALLRALQTETDAFDGDWSWAPYFITAFVLVVIAVLTALKIREKHDDRG